MALNSLFKIPSISIIIKLRKLRDLMPMTRRNPMVNNAYGKLKRRILYQRKKIFLISLIYSDLLQMPWLLFRRSKLSSRFLAIVLQICSNDIVASINYMSYILNSDYS